MSTTYTTPPINVNGMKPFSMVCRWPSVEDKMKQLDSEAEASGFGSKPGEVSRKFSDRLKASVSALVPLIEDTGCGLTAQEMAEDARFLMILWELSQYLFRGASFAGDLGATEDAGAVGV